MQGSSPQPQARAPERGGHGSGSRVAVRTRIQPFSASLKYLEELDLSDEDLTVEYVVMRVRDRVSGARIRTPCRGQGCKHVEVFDRGTFLHYNRCWLSTPPKKRNGNKPAPKPKQAQCPLCYAVTEELQIDEMAVRLLALVPEGVDEVQICLRDLSWRVLSEVDESGARLGGSEEASREGVPSDSAAPASGLPRQSACKVDPEVVCLDSDESDKESDCCIVPEVPSSDAEEQTVGVGGIADSAPRGAREMDAPARAESDACAPSESAAPALPKIGGDDPYSHTGLSLEAFLVDGGEPASAPARPAAQRHPSPSRPAASPAPCLGGQLHELPQVRLDDFEAQKQTEYLDVHQEKLVIRLPQAVVTIPDDPHEEPDCAGQLAAARRRRRLWYARARLRQRASDFSPMPQSAEVIGARHHGSMVGPYADSSALRVPGVRTASRSVAHYGWDARAAATSGARESPRIGGHGGCVGESGVGLHPHTTVEAATSDMSRPWPSYPAPSPFHARQTSIGPGAPLPGVSEHPQNYGAEAHQGEGQRWGRIAGGGYPPQLDPRPPERALSYQPPGGNNMHRLVGRVSADPAWGEGPPRGYHSEAPWSSAAVHGSAPPWAWDGYEQRPAPSTHAVERPPMAPSLARGDGHQEMRWFDGRLVGPSYGDHAAYGNPSVSRAQRELEGGTEGGASAVGRWPDPWLTQNLAAGDPYPVSNAPAAPLSELCSGGQQLDPGSTRDVALRSLSPVPSETDLSGLLDDMLGEVNSRMDAVQ